MVQQAARWLTDEEQRIWRDYLAGVSAIDRALDQELRRFGLGLSEYEILVELSEAPDRQLRMSDLAAAVRQSRSRLTHTVKRLERKQLITRENCSGDRRGVIASLTPTGYALLDEVAPVHVESVRSCFIDVVSGPDFEALGRMMAAVLTANSVPRR